MQRFSRLTSIFTFCAFLLLPGIAHASDLRSSVHELTLKNGMKWLFVERKGAPVFSGVIMLKVGGMDEAVGKTGVAHVFEHMAFKGSSKLGAKNFEEESKILAEIEKLGEEREKAKALGAKNTAEVKKLTEQIAALEKEAAPLREKNEIWDVLMRNGAGDLNAFTSKDVTAYHASMPANRLELWANVFAEMIFEPSWREFYTERSVIETERRQFTESDPDGEMGEKILATAYNKGPYSWSTIGFMDDISKLTIADARNFYEKYYVPSNMVGVIVGDIPFSKAKKIISRVFENFPNRESAKREDNESEERKGISEKFHFKAQPAVAIAFHKPTLPNESEYAFDVIDILMCEGMSSRLIKDLVYDRRLAHSIHCSDSYPGSRLPNLVLIWAEPMKGVSTAKLEAEITNAVAKLQTEKVSKEELEMASKNMASTFVFGLESNISLAQALATYQTIFGDWTLVADYPKKISDVTAEDVMNVAKKYLSPKDKILVERVGGAK